MYHRITNSLLYICRNGFSSPETPESLLFSSLLLSKADLDRPIASQHDSFKTFLLKSKPNMLKQLGSSSKMLEDLDFSSKLLLFNTSHKEYSLELTESLMKTVLEAEGFEILIKMEELLEKSQLWQLQQIFPSYFLRTLIERTLLAFKTANRSHLWKILELISMHKSTVLADIVLEKQFLELIQPEINGISIRNMLVLVKLLAKIRQIPDKTMLLHEMAPQMELLISQEFQYYPYIIRIIVQYPSEIDFSSEFLISLVQYTQTEIFKNPEGTASKLKTLNLMLSKYKNKLKTQENQLSTPENAEELYKVILESKDLACCDQGLRFFIRIHRDESAKLHGIINESCKLIKKQEQNSLNSENLKAMLSYLDLMVNMGWDIDFRRNKFLKKSIGRTIDLVLASLNSLREKKVVQVLESKDLRHFFSAAARVTIKSGEISDFLELIAERIVSLIKQNRFGFKNLLDILKAYSEHYSIGKYEKDSEKNYNGSKSGNISDGNNYREMDNGSYRQLNNKNHDKDDNDSHELREKTYTKDNNIYPPLNDETNHDQNYNTSNALSDNNDHGEDYKPSNEFSNFRLGKFFYVLLEERIMLSLGTNLNFLQTKDLLTMKNAFKRQNYGSRKLFEFIEEALQADSPEKLKECWEYYKEREAKFLDRREKIRKSYKFANKPKENNK